MGSLIDGFKKAKEADKKQDQPEEAPASEPQGRPPAEAKPEPELRPGHRRRVFDQPEPAAPEPDPEPAAPDPEESPAEAAIPPEVAAAEEEPFESRVLETSLRVKELEDELEETRRKLEDKSQAYEKVYDQLVRLVAEFDNFKKRAQKDRVETVKYANERLLLDILPTVDNLERALDHAGEEGGGKGLIEGIQMVLSALLTALDKHGVTPIDSLGAAFDPNLHNAVMEVETEEANPGTVVEEFQKGYRIADRLLRAAMVKVAKKPGGAPDAPAEAEPEPAS